MNKNSWTKQTNMNFFGTYLSSPQRTDSFGIRTKKAADFLLLFYCEKENINNVFHANTSYSLISVKMQATRRKVIVPSFILASYAEFIASTHYKC